MTRSCIYCHDDLGANEVVEGLAAGRRIAFDTGTGRVWAVCGACGRWNLAPIEVRWEVVERCARLFDRASRRFTEHGVGLAEVDGVELVRVDPADESRLAGWRYGEVFRARFRAWRLVQPALFLLGVAFIASTTVAAGLAWGPGGAITALVGVPLLLAVTLAGPNPVVAKVPAGGEGREIRRNDLEKVRLVPVEGGGWALRLPDGTLLSGADAYGAAALLLPVVNDAGGGDVEVRRATDYTRRKGAAAEAVFAAAARRYGEAKTARLARLDPHIRLALEMTAHEDAERRALGGELRYLRRAWEEAEALARIEDRLAFPRGPGALLGRLPERARSRTQRAR